MRLTRSPRRATRQIIADVALATSLLAGAGSVALYFGRFADAPPERATLPLPRASLARVEFRY